MDIENDGNPERQLDEFFHAYREACEYSGPSANFMPMIWQKIEARQSGNTLFLRIARSLVTAAVALSLVLALFLLRPNQNSDFYNSSYVEALSADNLTQNALYMEDASIDPVSDVSQN